MHMKKLFSGGLRFYLVLLVLLASTPAFLLIFYGGVQQRRTMIKDGTEKSYYLSQIAAHNMTQMLEGIHYFLIALVQSESVQNQDYKAASTYFAGLIKEFPEYLNIGLIGLDGIVVASALPVALKTDLSDRLYFKEALQSNDFSCGEYQVGRITKIPSINFAYPLKNDMPKGVIYLALSLETLRKVFSGIHVPPGYELIVADHRGIVLYSNTAGVYPLGKPVRQSKLQQAFFAMDNGTEEISTADALKRIYSIAHVKAGTGFFHIALGFPEHYVTAPADRMLFKNLLILSFIAVLVLLFAFVFGELFFMRKTKRLVRLVDSFAQGDLSVRSGFSRESGEIGFLARSFDAMADAISERESALKKTRDQLQDMAANIPGVLYQFYARNDGSMGFQYVSQRSQELFGLDHQPEDYLERFKACVVKADRERLLASIRQAAATETVWQFEGQFRKPTGETIYFTSIANPQRKGEEIIFNGVLGDATKRRQAEDKLKAAYKTLRAREEELAATNEELTAQEIQLRAANQQLQASFQQLKASELTLRESEARFRAIAENTPDVILTTDNTSTILFCNNAAEKMFGCKKEEMIGMPVSQLLTPRLREKEQTRREAYLASGASDFFGSPMESVAVRKDGTEFHVEVSISPWEIDGTMYYTSIIRDISLKKRSEEERSRLIAAVEQAEEAIVITDKDSIIQYVNHAFVRITGYGRSEAIGKKPNILKSGRQPDDFYRKLWETISRGEVWKGHFVNKCRNGTLYEEEAIITPLRDSEGNIINFVAVKRDVTQQMKLERQYRQAQKMEAIGTLAGGIAHDFNNILSVIYGYTQIVLEKVKKDSDIHSCLSQTLSAAERAQSLVKQILTFSRQTEQERQPVRAGVIIKETCKFLRASLPTTIEIKVDIRTPESQILGDPTQIHQIVMNLCTNAHHAMKQNGGILEVVLDEAYLPHDDISMHPEIRKGDYVRLSVSDTGGGIEQKNLEKIFDPYFTTKEVGEGTGLGLAVVHGIVKDYGGGIRVHSEEGKGTKFDLYFPRLEQQPSPADAAIDEIVQGGEETILFIDDEQLITGVAKEMLEKLGYTVVAATSPDEALEKFEQSGDSFDLVITDKTMPHITGFTLAKTVKAVKKGVPVILCTGFQEPEDAEKIQEAHIDYVLTKPLRRQDLAAAIRTVLDKKSKMS